MPPIPDDVFDFPCERKAQRVLVVADLLVPLGECGDQARAEEPLAIDDVVVALLAQLAYQLEQVAGLVRAFVPYEQLPQERVPIEQPVVAFAHHEVDHRIRVERVQLFQQRGREHGIAEEGGLYDQKTLGHRRGLRCPR